MKIVDLRGTAKKTNVQILWFFILYFPVFADLQVHYLTLYLRIIIIIIFTIITINIMINTIINTIIAIKLW